MTSTLGAIAEHLDAQLQGDPAVEISGVASLRRAMPGQLSFYTDKRYAADLAATRAAAVVLNAAAAAASPVASLIVEDPYLAYTKAAALLHPPAPFSPGIHPTAVVDAGSDIAADCFVGANTVIGNNVSIGAGTYIGPGCVLGTDVSIDTHCRLQPGVTVIAGAKLGKRVLLHPGVVIGADGFGLANDAGRWLKIPQLGSVVIGADVEIGANTTIDRGALEHTVIGAGVKIDNQVQIGHNVRIGEHTAIAGGVVIAGSVTLGRRCMIGGASAIAGHIDIADDVLIAGMSGVPNSIRQPGAYASGVPLTEQQTWRKNMARFRKLDALARRVFRLEKLVE